MQEKLYATPCGEIHYWVNSDRGPEAITLVFLPGLTADHRLFDKQIACFEGKYNLLVWDAPGHGASRPFRLTRSSTKSAPASRAAGRAWRKYPGYVSKKKY